MKYGVGTSMCIEVVLPNAFGSNDVVVYILFIPV